MSLILDALRKMEEERKARRGGTVDIRPIVLGQRRQPVAPARSRLVPVVIGLVLLAGGIGAGLFLLGRSPSSPPQSAAEPARAGVPAVQAPPQSAPLPAPAPAVPARPEPLPAAPVTPAAKPRSLASEPSAAAGEPAETPLTISGIAWQEERPLRRAVVNGALVAEGAEVAGARVVEIRERSVRFARGGRTFEIGYSSPFPH